MAKQDLPTQGLSTPVREFVKAMEFLLHALRKDEPITNDDRVAMELYVSRLQAELSRDGIRDHRDEATLPQRSEESTPG